ncbi:MAG: TerC/Alx family metal homeostasis membrane protein [Vicinamibacteria bacterium]|nr:TerC/Alx family metal homeostasis membrane protein [Vicinamibacteria bacterium]
MIQPLLFPFTEYWWFYAGFTAFVVLLLVVDLGVFHRKAHAVELREAAAWSATWIVMSLLFNYVFYRYMLARFPNDPRLVAVPGFVPHQAALNAALEFLAGYVTEKALSFDNIFVFVLVMKYFHVESRYQHRVLFAGILGALVFRAIFISFGAVLLRFEIVMFVFGAFLIVTGARIMAGGDTKVDPEHNAVVRLFRRFVPVTPRILNARFFVRRNGRIHATPLFIALLFLEMTDVIFAVDSVPAIFGLTREPLIVFTSNICAILGLRALYFLLAGAIERFYMLKYGLGLVLVFIGLKMIWLNHVFDGHLPITVSLVVVVGVIAVSIALSFIFPRAVESPDETGASAAVKAKEVS